MLREAYAKELETLGHYCKIKTHDAAQNDEDTADPDGQIGRRYEQENPAQEKQILQIEVCTQELPYKYI